MSILKKIEFWSRKYDLSFQFWGDGNNNVFISKDDIDLTSFGGEETINDIFKRTIEWCERVNPKTIYE